MRRIFFLLISILLIYSIRVAGKVSWQQLPISVDGAVRCFYVDSTDTTMYMGGDFNYINEAYTGCVVKLNQDYTLVPLPPISGGPALSIVKWRGELYVGGAGALLRLNGSSWEMLDRGVNGCLYPYNGKLLIAGNHSNGFGGDTSLTAAIIEYDGTAFRAFAGVDSVIRKESCVNSLLEYKGDLVVGGNIDPNPPISIHYKEILKWTGTAWAPLGGGIQGGGHDEVGSLLVVNDDLFVAGYFRKDEGAPGNSIAKWNGTNWDDLGGGLRFVLYGMSKRGDTVLATGGIEEVAGNGCQQFAAYTKGKWCINTTPFDNITTVSADFFGDLIVGGGFQTIGTDSCGGVARITNLCHRFYPSAVEPAPHPANRLLVTPNPGNGKFNIALSRRHSTPTVNILVRSLSGQVIWQQSFQNSAAQFEAEIDLSFVPKGSFILEIATDGERLSKQLILL